MIINLNDYRKVPKEPEKYTSDIPVSTVIDAVGTKGYENIVVVANYGDTFDVFLSSGNRQLAEKMLQEAKNQLDNA